MDQNGRRLVSSTVDEEGAAEHFYYHFDEGYTEYVDPAGVSELHYYDERNRETKIVYADGSYIENTYDENNNITSVRSRSGYITDYSYDENNNLIHIDYPDGSHETMEYNEWSQLTEKIDADGNRLANEYDDSGNLKASRLYGADGALKSEETMSYTSQGRISEKTRWNTGPALSTTEYYSYDEYGNIAEVIDGEGHAWDYTYSITGLLERIEDPLRNATEYEYTPSGRVTKVSYPDGSSEQSLYTNRKDIDYLIDRAGNRYEYTYNKRHNLLSVENPLGESVLYTYNEAGKPLTKSIYSATDELSAHWQYEYDPYTGDLVSQKQQLDKKSFAETQYLYDNGLVWKQIDPAGTSTEFDYDGRDRVVSKTITGQSLEFPLKEYFSYTGRGLLETYTDPRSNETEYDYTAMGNIASVTNPDLSRRQWEYDGAGRLLSFTDEEDYRTSYRYSGSGERTKTIHPDGSTEQWEYNRAGRLIAYTGRNETRFRYELDTLGRIITEKLPEPYAGAERSYTYNNRDQILTYTDSNNHTWTRNYDALGNLVETIDPEGNVTKNEYTPLGGISKTITPDEAVWQRSYDMAGRLVSATDPLEAVTTYGYDARGNLLWEEDPLGRKDRYTWDSLGRLVSTRDGENTGVDYRYDEAGNRIEETQTGGEPYRYFYDSRNRLSREVNRLGDEKLYEYYRNGRLSEIRDFNGTTTTFRYDEAALLSEKEFSGGDTETYTYDGLGNVLSAVNPSSELEYVYDPLGRLTKSTDQLKDQSISYSYDAAANRTSLSWADGNRTTGWSYNELNLPVTMTDAEGEVTRFNYDPLGRETERILANGITREITYDKAGRISSISHDEEWNNNGHHLGYGRNSHRNGRLPSRLYAYNEAGQKILQVDELGRLTAWEYDNAGRLSEASYSFAGGKSVADFRERIYLGVIPEEIKKDHHNGHNRDEGWLNGRGSSRYEMGNLFGRNSVLQDLGFSEEDFSSGLEEAYSELSDVFPDLKGFDYRAAARMKDHSFFERDRSSLSGSLPGEVRRWFNHGELNRLLRQPLWTEEFSYDQAGNIAGKTNGWGEIAYTYNEENRLTKAGEREYTWDANGNMTGESLGALSASYSYDGENRLTGITSNHRGFIGSPGRPMDKGILYSYDSFGRRISREEITDLHGGRYRDRFGSTGERVSYLYDGLGFDVLAEGRDAAGRSSRGGWHGNSGRVFNPTSEYLRTNGSVIVRNDITGSGHSFLDFFHGGSPSRSYYTQDGLGSAMGIFNKNGNLEERYAYDSFGRLTEGRFDGNNRLGYNGKRMDPYSGRYDYGYRDYDPLTMRWTTVDPVKDGVNWYVHVGNDPVNFIDPTGLRELFADDISGNPITLPVQRQEEYLKTKTNIVIQRDSANDFYEDTLSINIGNQTLQQLGVQSEADSAGSEDQTLPAGDYKGELWEASGHYKNAILIQEPDFFIHPDQWTTEKYIDDPKNGPWSKPLSEGCQICKLADFDILKATLKGFGFEYGTGDTIDVEIIDKKNK